MKLPISAVIVTYNEELNLPNCLKSIAGWVDEILIVDGGPDGAYSVDKTPDIAKKYGAKFTKHSYENQAQQFNWALDNFKIKNEWILRLDSDEVMLPELWQEIAEILPKTPDDVSGFYMKRRVYFMGRWIKHGGYYPTWMIRLFRKGKGRYEKREMDEHVVLSEGRAEKLKNDFIDDNRKNLEFWTDRQNLYTSREAAQILNPEKAGGMKAENLGGPVAGRRRNKNFYLKLPLFCRAFLYYIYRYFFLLGFLDGKEGFIFHFLQGFWYRFLVDAKIYEIKNKSKK